jgi:hypothetical protein
MGPGNVTAVESQVRESVVLKASTDLVDDGSCRMSPGSTSTDQEEDGAMIETA